MRRSGGILLLAALAACAPDSGGPTFGTGARPHRDPATIYINNGSEPESIDPGLSHDGASSVLILQLFEGLTSVDPRDGRLIQGVAERYDKSADNRRFRFHLRPEARWSDGVPVTAHDFEYAWKRVLRPSTGAVDAASLYVLRNGKAFNTGQLKDEACVGVRAVDDLTLDVTLEQPTPYFLELTSAARLSPLRKDVIEGFEGRGQGALWVRPGNIVVNGPYTLDTWDFQDAITMKQNFWYWARDELRIRRIVWLMVSHQHTAMNLYKTGELDLLGDNSALPAEYGRALADKQDYRRAPYLGTLWYELNTKRPPLSDVRVRRALNMAIDKDQLTATMLGAGQTPARHYVPDFVGSGYAEQAARDKESGQDPFASAEARFDPERARALLGEAGYAVSRSGSGLRAEGFPALEILYNTAEEHRAVAVAIQDMWKRHLGISVTLRSEEWKVMLKSVRDRQFQIARLGWFADVNHPHDWISSFRSDSAQNPTGWGDAAVDALVDRAAREGDPGESIRLYRQAEALALSGMPRLPLYFRARATMVKPWVKGFYGTPRDTHLIRWLWIDPDYRSHPGNEPAGAPRELPAAGVMDR